MQLLGGSGEAAVASEGQSVLYPVASAAPRASLVQSWTVARRQSDALSTVTSSGFRPSQEAVLEENPGIEPSGGGPQGTVTYLGMGAQAARVTVDSPVAAMLLVRNSYDPDWHATVDGRDARVLPMDYVAQGVAVPAGHHVVDLRYDDPSIEYGLAGSAASIAVLLGAAAAFSISARRRTRPAPLSAARSARVSSRSSSRARTR